jgi:fermentation-respiration switch protein FrsA (DUF1100 family)
MHLPVAPIVLAVATLASLAAIVVSAILAWRVIRPGVHTYWDEYTFLPGDMGVPFENVSFTSPDGLRLAGWLMPHSEAVASLTLASGYRDRKTSLLPIAAGLWRRGFNVFLFDFRNQGDSAMDNVQTMGQREVGDMLAAVDLVAERLPALPIGCLGWSMGGAVSILAAAREQRIGAVVADSAFANQTDVIAANFTQMTRLPAFPFVALAEVIIRIFAGYWPRQVRPADAIAHIAPRPILLIHGEKDDMCPVENGRTLFARAGEPKQIWLLPRAKHVGAYFANPERYIERAAAFFRSSLATQAQPQ